MYKLITKEDSPIKIDAHFENYHTSGEFTYLIKDGRSSMIRSEYIVCILPVNTNIDEKINETN
jgi:hypothetical protein